MCFLFFIKVGLDLIIFFLKVICVKFILGFLKILFIYGIRFKVLEFVIYVSFICIYLDIVFIVLEIYER